MTAKTESSSTVRAEAGRAEAPTDLELMMFADGELGEPRLSEVAAFLAEEGGDAEAKLFGMKSVGALVRDNASRLATLHAADAIAARVMESIATERAAADDAGAEEAHLERIVKKSVTRSSKPRVGLSAVPKIHAAANDNRSSEKRASDKRLIYGIAGLAAAAAIALGFWGRSAPAPEASNQPVVREVPAASPTAPIVLTAVALEPAPSASSNEAHPDAIDDSSVKVASVDFGAKAGTVYYVPKDTPGATTAVVWLADE